MEELNDLKVGDSKQDVLLGWHEDHADDTVVAPAAPPAMHWEARPYAQLERSMANFLWLLNHTCNVYDRHLTVAKHNERFISSVCRQPPLGIAMHKFNNEPYYCPFFQRDERQFRQQLVRNLQSKYFDFKRALKAAQAAVERAERECDPAASSARQEGKAVAKFLTQFDEEVEYMFIKVNGVLTSAAHTVDNQSSSSLPFLDVLDGGASHRRLAKMDAKFRMLQHGLKLTKLQSDENVPNSRKQLLVNDQQMAAGIACGTDAPLGVLTSAHYISIAAITGSLLLTLARLNWMERKIQHTEIRVRLRRILVRGKQQQRHCKPGDKKYFNCFSEWCGTLKRENFKFFRDYVERPTDRISKRVDKAHTNLSKHELYHLELGEMQIPEKRPPILPPSPPQQQQSRRAQKLAMVNQRFRQIP